MNQKLKSEKEVLQKKSFLNILSKEKFSPQEERELKVASQEIVNELNKSIA